MELKRIKTKITPENKRGQISISDGPAAIMLVGFIFLIMMTIAFVGEKYGESMTANSTAFNVAQDLQKEIGDNTSIAGMVMTITLIGMVLGVLIGVFAGVLGNRGRNI